MLTGLNHCDELSPYEQIGCFLTPVYHAVPFANRFIRVVFAYEVTHLQVDRPYQVVANHLLQLALDSDCVILTINLYTEVFVPDRVLAPLVTRSRLHQFLSKPQRNVGIHPAENGRVAFYDTSDDIHLNVAYHSSDGLEHRVGRASNHVHT